jgi:triacylglycerol lipase
MSSEAGEQGACPVVTLHGLGRTRLAMWPLARRLGALGYQVTNLGYFGPRGLQTSVETVFGALEERGLHDAPLDLVTHSMGGIVARALLADGRIQVRRLVQLAPPNRGAWIADRVRKIPLFGRVPAFRDLGQSDEALIEALGQAPPEVEVGVVAGQSASAWLGGEPGDGVVRVAETHLPSARDWILLPHFHTVIMNGRDTLAEVDHFLQQGRFSPHAERLGLDSEGQLSREHPQPEPEQVTT